MTTPIIFFGSDQYSASVLATLIAAPNIVISAVVTTPGKPEKKTSDIIPNEVTKLANTHNLKVFIYPSNQDDLSNFTSDLKSTLSGANSLGISASFGRILPAPLLSLFPRGVYNLHPSLLPQYRNVAPVPYALAMGDQTTGITLFRMGAGVDNGQIIAQASAPINPTDTTPTLLSHLFNIGADMLIKWLADKKPNTPIHQYTDQLIFTRRLTRESGFVEWEVLQQLLRGEPLQAWDTSNPLIKLRLTHHPDRNTNILPDLIRALTGYEKVWTTAPTKKGDLNISFPAPDLVLIPGKPRPIPYSDFAQYYL